MSGDVSSSEKVNLNVVHGSKFSVEINLDSSVSEFKDVLAQNLNIPAQQQRLIYKGRVLKDDRTLNSYGLQADHTVHLVCALPAASTNTTVATSGVPVEIPNFGETQNSDMMRDIMNMPAIQNMMNNGDIVRDLIMSNPQMREVIDRNPELAHIFNDPATLRQTLEASRNPELMREMMRNTDRAMSNIEASPEGFNMLRRMYETVQEPLMNATTMAANSGSQTRDISSNSSATGAETTTASLAPNTNPLPNPWSNAGAAGVAQRNTARSTRAGGTPAIGGLSGLGLPNMDQFVPTPAVAQRIRSLLSSPQAMNRVLGPQMQNMLDSNPQLREMMQNPNFVSRLTSPETLQRVSSLQQSLLSFSQQPTTQEPSQTDTGAGGLSNMGLDFWMNMLGFLGAAGVNVPNTPNVPAEQLYANQLSQLQEMGFFDTQENIRALSVTAGNVHAAVERLLGNPGQ